ncbi:MULTISPECIES: hypothetical protein [Azotobacter]|uniref:hypothetical protein n=1 Tax=Azotobacter TaxID=352 RepID=UPI000AAE868E|nr:hypothetical protein [Azotobacter vinelandii]GLK58099.1 hypothetical protein GCM10017624_02560 [Azotobacter vinelandii]
MRPPFLSLALPGQQVEMNFTEHCPEGSFDICHQTRIEGIPYRQGIHHHGAANNTRYLEPSCENLSDGRRTFPRAQQAQASRSASAANSPKLVANNGLRACISMLKGTPPNFQRPATTSGVPSVAHPIPPRPALHKHLSHKTMQDFLTLINKIADFCAKPDNILSASPHFVAHIACQRK